MDLGHFGASQGDDTRGGLGSYVKIEAILKRSSGQPLECFPSDPLEKFAIAQWLNTLNLVFEVIPSWYASS